MEGGGEDGGGGVSGGGGLGGESLICDPPRVGMGGAIRAGFGEIRCFPDSGGDGVGLPSEVGWEGAGLPLEMGGDEERLLRGCLVTVGGAPEVGGATEVGGGGAGLLGAGLPPEIGKGGVGFPGRGGIFWLEGILGMGFGRGGLEEGVAVGGGDSAPTFISKL